jgi:hypothetical protein
MQDHGKDRKLESPKLTHLKYVDPKYIQLQVPYLGSAGTECFLSQNLFII